MNNPHYTGCFYRRSIYSIADDIVVAQWRMMRSVLQSSTVFGRAVQIT